MKAFADVALQRFENEMVEHSKEFSPRLCKALGDEPIGVAVRQAMQRADNYGFTNRGPIRLYIELMFLYGSDFDTDPQYLDLATVLHSAADQMKRAEEIHERVVEYQKKVSGAGAVNLRNGLKAILDSSQNPDVISSDNFELAMLQSMAQIYPQKYKYIGKTQLTQLIAKGRTVAKGYQFQTRRSEAMLVAMMFTLGHGCCTDPLYPWISRTLTNEKIDTPEGRARRLEKKATTWLSQVLAGPWRGEQA